MREVQRARLHRLADSINDTARMARTSLSLVLLVALYLSLTLVASTDENLLLNGQVTLPQAGVGISVAQSYIFAPPIFFYLHIQLLFLLSVLARKVRTFEAALKEEFPDAFLPSLQNKIETKREECWEWLSAFAFVQLFRRTSGMPHVLKLGAGTLAWFGIEAVPLALLFVIDISFVRYQSTGITWSHHCIFILDLVSIIIFNRLVFLRRNRIWGSASVSVAVPGNAGVLPAFGVDQRPAFLGRICRLRPFRIWWKHLRGLSARRLNWRTLVRIAKVMPAWLWISARGTIAMGMVFLLIYAAHPPQFDPQTVEDDQKSIWRESPKREREKKRTFLQAVKDYRENPLDAGPCRWWGFGCRYLDVRNKWLLGAQPEGSVDQISDEITPETFGDIRRFHLGSRRFHLGSPDLARRRLRFARFGSVYLQSVDLQEAELQGADLKRAELQGARLQEARLQGANLWEARLQRANLWGARLQGADLWEARLQEANLAWARLQGARLQGAELQGANLEGAELQGANLEGAKLQGANLAWAKLQGSRGKPAWWYPAWIRHVSVDFSGSSEQYLEELLSDEIKNIKLAWLGGLPLEQYLIKIFRDDSKRGSSGGAKPDDTDWVFHHRKGAKSCEPEAPDVLPDGYWCAWTEWASEFACENEYTARSILQRLSLSEFRDPPLRWSSSGFLSFVRENEKEIYDRVRNKVRKALSDARTRGDPECAGLRDLSENEWQAFVDG